MDHARAWFTQDDGQHLCTRRHDLDDAVGTTPLQRVSRLWLCRYHRQGFTPL